MDLSERLTIVNFSRSRIYIDRVKTKIRGRSMLKEKKIIIN